MFLKYSEINLDTSNQTFLNERPWDDIMDSYGQSFGLLYLHVWCAKLLNGETFNNVIS